MMYPKSLKLCFSKNSPSNNDSFVKMIPNVDNCLEKPVRVGVLNT